MILTGCGSKKMVLTSRIMPTNLSFQFTQLQYPIKLYFLMTFNKAQGQTLNIADLDLIYNVFPIVNCTITCHMQTKSIVITPKDETSNALCLKIFNA